MKRQRVEFENTRGQKLAAALELPDGQPRAFALFAHCFTCTKDVIAASRVSRALVEHDMGVLRFDFTGLGGSEGDFANTNFSSNIQDLHAAVAFMRHQGFAPTLLVGHSLGGAAVLAAAPQIPEVRAVVTIGAPAEPAHVKRHFQPEDEQAIARDGSAMVKLAGRPFRIAKQFFDDLEKHKLEDTLPVLNKALLVLHSPLDTIVSIGQARRIYQAARHPKSFISLDDADHLLTRPQDSQYVGGIIAAWVSRYLPPVKKA